MQSKRVLRSACAAAGVALAFGAAAPAQAQSSVTLTGLVDLYAGSVKMAGDANHYNGMGNNGMSTSWWGVSGSEDLGRGTQAKFSLGSFLRPTNGATGRFGDGNGPFADTFWARDAKVGLSGRLGALWLGRGEPPNFLPTILFNPFGDSFAFSPLVLHANVSPFANGTVPSNLAANRWGFTSTSTAADTGWSNMVAYTTPDFHGLKATVNYQFANPASSATSNGNRNVGGSLLYFHGPIGLTAFWEQARSHNPIVFDLGTTRTDWMLGGSYDFTVVKLYATYGQARDSVAGEKLKTVSLGASVPVGAGRVLAAYAHTRSQMLSGTRQTATVGYDYDLSKRTDLYANLMYDRATSDVGGLGWSGNGTSFAVGIRHRF